MPCLYVFTQQLIQIKMLSKACGYGIRAVLYLALKSAGDTNIGIAEIAQELVIPQPFLGKIMQTLVRQKIVKSVKGPSGGFSLTTQMLQLPIVRIVEAIDGLSVFEKCMMALPECNKHNPCPLHNELWPFRNRILRYLSETSIADLVADVAVGNAVLQLVRKDDSA